MRRAWCVLHCRVGVATGPGVLLCPGLGAQSRRRRDTAPAMECMGTTGGHGHDDLMYNGRDMLMMKGHRSCNGNGVRGNHGRQA